MEHSAASSDCLSLALPLEAERRQSKVGQEGGARAIACLRRVVFALAASGEGRSKQNLKGQRSQEFTRMWPTEKYSGRPEERERDRKRIVRL